MGRESEAIHSPVSIIRPGNFACNANTGELVPDSLNPGQFLHMFRPESEITEEMRNPDYALKQLAKLNNGKYLITCSKCHHCR